MKESSWLTSTDPSTMLAFLQGNGRPSERKLRLVLTACCRRIWPLLAKKRSKKAVEVAERFADGEVSLEQLSAASRAAYLAREALRESSHPYTAAAYVAIETCRPAPLRMEVSLSEARRAVTDRIASTSNRVIPPTPPAEERAYQAHLLRDVFGPQPFRSLPTLSAAVLAWSDRLVVKLAQTAYEESLLPSGHLDPRRLAVLCDALLDAGCPADHELLGHLRGPGPHVRACWAVDLLTGRE
jgi:hypothetical protein